MAIKLIAIDMGGTLLNPQHEITAGVKAAITAAKKRGIKIVLASGRPWIGMERYLMELDLQEKGQYAIACNGAQVHRAEGGELISEITLNYDDYRYFEALSRELGVHFQAMGRSAIYTANKDISEYTIQESYVTGIDLRYCSVDEMDPQMHFLKLMMVDKPALLDVAIARLPQELRSAYTVEKSALHYLEIIHKQVSKGYGVSKLAELLNLQPEEVMAIGDQENDIAMLEYSGTGVAMGNAVDSVKMVSQFITRTNMEDGVAYAIEKFALC